MIIFSTKSNSSTINRGVEAGKLVKLTKGVYYTVNTNLEVEINSKINEILSHLKVDGIISYGSGLEQNLFDNNKKIWITGKKDRNIILGEFEIVVFRGEYNDEGTCVLDKTQLRMPNIFRACLENFITKKAHLHKCDKKNALEKIISYANQNQNGWAIAYANLEKFSKSLNLEKEYEIIIKLLDEYKKNKKVDILDNKRVHIFEQFLDNLDKIELSFLESIDKKNSVLCENIAFFESYFSNYIEGTEFEVDEAYSIIFDPKHHYERAKDGHDIKKSYKLMYNNIQNPINIENSKEYLNLLNTWHYELMSHREDEMIVGEFKKAKNKAGATTFVIPEKVKDMLMFSFDLSQKIKDPIKKAFFLKTTFTEIHPFEDGNGRLSRIILNNFLSLEGKKRIIIPNVFREDYILGLKAFSNQNSLPIIKTLNKAILIANSIPYQITTNKLIEWLQNNSAFCNPNESLWGVKTPVPDIDNSTQIDLFNQITKKPKF